MLSLPREPVVARFTDLFTQGDQATSYALWALLVVVAALLLWRLWTFTLHPLLNPLEPREVPYWIPCESHPRL